MDDRAAHEREADAYFAQLDYAFERQLLQPPVTLPVARVVRRARWRRVLGWLL